MYQIAVCDDEKEVRDGLEQFLNRYSQEKGVHLNIMKYESANELLLYYPQNIDLIFMDIRMSGIDGMTAAGEIRKFDPKVCLIFITTMHQLAINGYEVRAFGFIKKPIRYAEIQHELTCALTQIQGIQKREQFLTIRGSGTLFRLPISQISYCEVQGHSMKVCISGIRNEYRCTMKELEDQLASLGFFRCHTSYMVNGEYIKRIDPMHLILLDGTVIPISQRRRKEFMTAISHYIGERI